MSDLGAFIPTSCPRSSLGDFDEASWEGALKSEPESLDALVGSDMRAKGFDPKNADEVRAYWQTLLEPKQFTRKPSEIQPYFTSRLINKKFDGAEIKAECYEMKEITLYSVPKSLSLIAKKPCLEGEGFVALPHGSRTSP